jgi:saccharopine dehydrogenase (NAD+, L-lysine-forming)
MGKVLVIGAGGVGTVVIHKMVSLPEVFSDIMLASRNKSKCDDIARKVGEDMIKTAQVDADNVPQLVELIRSFKPDIVVNVALPYQDLHIMDAVWKPVWLILILQTMNLLMKLNMSTAGSGLTAINIKMPG